MRSGSTWVFTLLLFSIAAIGPPARAQTPLDCYQTARDATLLSEDEILSLCCQSESLASVQCFLLVKDETFLSDQRAIELCQCTQNLQPAECFINAEDTTPSLSDDQRISLCAAIPRGLIYKTL